MFEKKIGVDLGTANVLVYVKGHGIVVQEPMLRYFISRIVGRFRLFRPIVMVSVPVGVTSVEERAVRDAARQASGRESYVIPEPLAAAIGAGLPIDTPTGNMVVDIGGGTSEAAVVAMYGIVVSSSVRVGGVKFDESIASYIRRKYNLMIGEQTAEEIKLTIGSALPRTITVTSDEVTEALAEPLSSVVGVTKSVLEQTPPELASDIIDRGMVLTGGGALLRNVDRMLTQETGVPGYVAENSMACVALGAGRALDIYDAIRRSMVAV